MFLWMLYLEFCEFFFVAGYSGPGPIEAKRTILVPLLRKDLHKDSNRGNMNAKPY